MMQSFPITQIIRHKRENKKKCSLQCLVGRPDFLFSIYPPRKIIPLDSEYLLLSIDGEPLTPADSERGLLLLDGTWRYATRMKTYVDSKCKLETRSIPKGWKTAYPRRQEDCDHPENGLASIEALFIAYYILGRDTAGLFDNYHWKERFFELNKDRLVQRQQSGQQAILCVS